MLPRAVLVSELQAANDIRRKALHQTERALAQHDCCLYLSLHFLQRFDERIAYPLRSVRDLDIALRIIVNKVDDLKGKQIAMLIGSFSVFIFDFKDPRLVRLVTYWTTDRKPFAALNGRGDATLYA